jgi:hypothetical protein
MIVLGVEMGTTEIDDVSGVVVSPAFVVAGLVTGVLDITPSERLTHNKSVQLNGNELLREDILAVLTVPLMLFMPLELLLVIGVLGATPSESERLTHNK